MTNYSELVEEERVHSAIFTSDEIFQDELDRIFYRYWVYIAHDSEVRNIGDYVTKWLGDKQLIVSRGRDGKVGVFFNRCRHRGSTVCMDESGNAEFFRCPYHGWTYNTSGDLVGVPYPSRYGEGFDKSTLGLAKVPRLGVSSGFIFISLNDEGPSLDEHLGLAKDYLADFVAASPVGSINLSAGASKSVFHGNWKFVGMDGYHTNFTHKTVLDLRQRKAGAGFKRGVGNTDKSPNETIDLGNGHCRLNLTVMDKVGVGATSTTSIAASIPNNDAGREYVRLMSERYGDQAAQVIHKAGDVHLHVWPNLQLIGSHVRVIHPTGPGTTEVTGYPAMLDGAPDGINATRVHQYEWFSGVAGFGSPDDTEIFERNQIGLQSDRIPWLVLARGPQDQVRTRADGAVIGNVTDEVPQRAQMRAWLRAMNEEVGA